MWVKRGPYGPRFFFASMVLEGGGLIVASGGGCAGGIADDQFRSGFVANDIDVAFFEIGIHAFHYHVDGQIAHGFEGLAHRGERGSGERGQGYVVEADHRALLGDFYAGLGQGADGAEGGEIVKGEQGGEAFFSLQ